MLISVSDAAAGKTLQVGAFVVDHVRIHRVTLYETSKAPTPDQIFGGYDESPVYAGPAFDELDETLQNAFYNYIQELGISDDFATKLADYCSAKEQNEYVTWLKSIKNFL